MHAKPVVFQVQNDVDANRTNCTDACSCRDCENQRIEKLESIVDVDESSDENDN